MESLNSVGVGGGLMDTLVHAYTMLQTPVWGPVCVSYPVYIKADTDKRRLHVFLSCDIKLTIFCDACMAVL